MALYFNALMVKIGPKNRMQPVFTANLVDCGFSLSIVGDISTRSGTKKIM